MPAAYWAVATSSSFREVLSSLDVAFDAFHLEGTQSLFLQFSHLCLLHNNADKLEDIQKGATVKMAGTGACTLQEQAKGTRFVQSKEEKALAFHYQVSEKM